MADYLALEKEYVERSRALAKDGGNAIRSFHGIVRAVGQDGALSRKSKELVALAMAIANGCEGCIIFHTRGCVQTGVSRDELTELLGVAVEMGGGPAAIHAGQALSCYDQMVAAN